MNMRMKARLFAYWLMLFPTLLFGRMSASDTTSTDDVLKYVNPFMGSHLDGRIIPVVLRPFGMVQLGPDTYYTGSGYHYSHGQIQSFSHTHVSGNGGGDMQDICVMPISGTKWSFPNRYPNNLQARYDHAGETAEPGYYSLQLPDEGIRVEFTATERCGVHRYTFPPEGANVLSFDMKRGNASRATTLPERFCDTVIVCRIEVVDDYTLRGFRITHGWAPYQHCYFYAHFSKPFSHAMLYNNGYKTESSDILSRDTRALLSFPEDGQPLEVQVGISPVSLEGAERNWLAEVQGRHFDDIRRETQDIWRRELAAFNVEGTEEDLKQTFYSCLYFTLFYPQLYNDVDGQYRSSDAQVYHTDRRYMAGVLGLWDTYRNHAPLIGMLRPDVVRDLMYTFLSHYRHCGILPMWTIAGQENNCMTGYHAMPEIADAMAKGLVDDSIAEPLLQAMVESANKDCFGYFDHDFRGARWYRRYHYVPFDNEAHSASKTMEYSYDDWCIAQVARILGHDDVAREFEDRGTWWKNLWDSEVSFINARDTLGHFRRPFNPFSPAPNYFQSDFCEGNSWQYSFFAPHDPEGLIHLIGGRIKFLERMDSLFTVTASGQQQCVFGRMGQYAHENEPVHHAAYLYALAGEPEKTCQIVSRIMREYYAPRPDGLCGNDDTGQMSAWYVQSAMGLFSMRHGRDEYVLGTPLFERLALHHSRGTLTILAPGVSRERCIVKEVKVNGKRWKQPVITGDVLYGGDVTIEFNVY